MKTTPNKSKTLILCRIIHLEQGEAIGSLVVMVKVLISFRKQKSKCSTHFSTQRNKKKRKKKIHKPVALIDNTYPGFPQSHQISILNTRKRFPSLKTLKFHRIILRLRRILHITQSEDGVGVWKAIRRWWPLVNAKSSYVVGNGCGVKFWRDTWCGWSLLSVSFPLLFVIARSKDAWVSECRC